MNHIITQLESIADTMHEEGYHDMEAELRSCIRELKGMGVPTNESNV